MQANLLLCELHAHTTAKDEQAVIEHLRSSRRAYVVPWGLRDELRKQLAA